MCFLSDGVLGVMGHGIEVGVLWVHLFGSWGFVGDEFRDKPAREYQARSAFSTRKSKII